MKTFSKNGVTATDSRQSTAHLKHECAAAKVNGEGCTARVPRVAGEKEVRVRVGARVHGVIPRPQPDPPHGLVIHLE